MLSRFIIRCAQSMEHEKEDVIMPHIAVTMFPGRNEKQKAALAKKLQTFVAEELSIDEKVVSVSVEDIQKEGWTDSMTKFTDDILFVKPGV